MNEINLGSVTLPIEAVTKTFAILAKRGAGKSYTGAVMAEEFYRNGIPFVVFDPIDVWWGLRLDKDGKSKGLPVVVFGLQNADIPLTRDMGKQIAQAVVKENVSVIISTFGMPKVAQRHLITEFATELLNINNTPRHIFIEEAHEFVPQRVFGGEGSVFNAVSNLVVMGRNRGLGVTLINQRASTVNKDVLTQIDTLLAFRNVSPQDRKALREWVEFHSAEGDFEAFMQSLPSLPTGEGWIWSPEFMGIFKRIKIRTRNTFHPDREKLGNTFVMPQLEQADVEEFIKRFSKDIPEVQEEVKETRVDKKQAENQIKAISEDYEHQLSEKDKEIEDLQGKLHQINQISGFEDNGGTVSEFSSTNSSALNMWLGKLPGGTAKVLKFLAEKYPMKFTRSQLALANGIKLTTFNKNQSYVLLLKKNNMIVEEGGLVWINPDLLK